MAASETAQRTIVRGCKYQPIARVVQHDYAKLTVGRFIREDDVGPAFLIEEAESLRNRVADSEFDRGIFDHNADYLARFASVSGNVEMPDADVSAPVDMPSIELEGVTVTADLQWRLRRQTRTNKIKIGAGMLRYSKGKALPDEIALWQSAFIYGYLREITNLEAEEPEVRLCLTLDAYTGRLHPAPTNSTARFNQMRSACATISERWDNIAPPATAVI